MATGQMDFLEALTAFPSLQALPREQLVKAVYLKDRRSLPDELKKLYETARAVRIPAEEPEDIARAVEVANGEVAAVNLGLPSDVMHYARTRLSMGKDRELSVDWGPRSDPLDGEVLPQLDGFELNLEGFRDVNIDDENAVVRCGVGARWREVFEHCRSRGWVFPLFPLLPIDQYIGDVIAGTATLVSYSGGPEACIRNVDLITPDARYGETGFDLVPNSAAGYDLNSLMTVMGRNLGIPVSVSFTLLSCFEDSKTFRFTLKGTEDMVKGLTNLAKTKVRPLKVVFGEGTASQSAFGVAGGPVVEVTIQGMDETVAPQEKALESAFGEGAEKETLEGIYHPLTKAPPRVAPSPLAEVRTSLRDFGALLQDFMGWKESSGPAFGVVGYLMESGTVGMQPMSSGPVSRGERFGRLVEIVQIARKHRCRLRTSPVIHLLEPETNLEKRFALIRRIKAEVDRPNVVNPSGVLWVPSSL